MNFHQAFSSAYCRRVKNIYPFYDCKCDEINPLMNAWLWLGIEPMKIGLSKSGDLPCIYAFKSRFALRLKRAGGVIAMRLSYHSS
ncbi:hypothetical protein SAMN04488028_10426 [Reichenbachiella agariperforans]|uniref:Uncharacterized protein n=1 Tax=Reichenbachiella agariperforans TaxID=156994 RepID=A0A1M6R396_REIAG|nr:hypothetical protein SAMN04488028_10426 [Reichenbachiella agariperforans]